ERHVPIPSSLPPMQVWCWQPTPTVYNVDGLHHDANARCAARHGRSADPAHVAERCPARLGHLRAHPADFARRPANEIRMTLNDLKLRARALLRPNRVEQQLEEELAFHVEREARKLIDEGITPTEARERAQARFGSTALAADRCRDERGAAVIDDTIRDVQYALRAFAKAPLAAFTIVVTVAIGLGAVAVLFTVLNTLIFRVDQVPDIGEMYAIERTPLANGDGALLTRPMFAALRADTHVFTDAYATVPGIHLQVDGRRMVVTLVTGNFFQVVRVNPVMGRALMPADDAPSGGNAVIVLSDKGWNRRF